MQKTKIIKIGLQLLEKYPHIFYDFKKEVSYNDEPSLFQFSVRFKEENAENSSTALAIGTSFNKTLALEKLFGEMIERYSLSYKSERSLKKCRYSRDNMLNPLLFLQFSEFQLKKMGSSEYDILSNKFYWESVASLYSKEKLLAPAELIYIPSPGEVREPILQFPTSSGAACGKNLEEAIYSGICELLERDAFMIAYFNKIKCPLIDIKSINDKQIREIIERVERYRLEVYLVVTTLDIPVFSVVAIVIDRTGMGPSVSVGMKAGLENKRVIIGAIEEALMTRAWARDQISMGEIRTKNTKINSLESRAFYWYPTKMIKYLDFWLANNLTSEYNLKQDFNGSKLDHLKRVLKACGVNIYYSDITDRLFKSFPITVVKVISPELQQLYLDEEYPYLGKKRLKEVPMKMTKNKRRAPISWNKIPHPFL